MVHLLEKPRVFQILGGGGKTLSFEGMSLYASFDWFLLAQQCMPRLTFFREFPMSQWVSGQTFQ